MLLFDSKKEHSALNHLWQVCESSSLALCVCVRVCVLLSPRLPLHKHKHERPYEGGTRYIRWLISNTIVNKIMTCSQSQGGAGRGSFSALEFHASVVRCIFLICNFQFDAEKSCIT